MALSSVLVLLALIDPSSAFVATGSAARASISHRYGGAGSISSLESGTVPPAAVGVVVPLVTGAGVQQQQQQQRRRRVQQLGMAIDTTNNPITSKVYGRADTKNSKTPDMNEEIAASGVS